MKKPQGLSDLPTTKTHYLSLFPATGQSEKMKNWPDTATALISMSTCWNWKELMESYKFGQKDREFIHVDVWKLNDWDKKITNAWFLIFLHFSPDIIKHLHHCFMNRFNWWIFTRFSLHNLLNCLNCLSYHHKMFYPEQDQTYGIQE